MIGINNTFFCIWLKLWINISIWIYILFFINSFKRSTFKGDLGRHSLGNCSLKNKMPESITINLPKNPIPLINCKLGQGICFLIPYNMRWPNNCIINSWFPEIVFPSNLPKENMRYVKIQCKRDYIPRSFDQCSTHKHIFFYTILFACFDYLHLSQIFNLLGGAWAWHLSQTRNNIRRGSENRRLSKGLPQSILISRSTYNYLLKCNFSLPEHFPQFIFGSHNYSHGISFIQKFIGNVEPCFPCASK